MTYQRQMNLWCFFAFCLLSIHVLSFKAHGEIGAADGASVDDASAVEGAPASSEKSDFATILSEVKAKHKPFYNAHIKTLSNGMRVIVIPNNRAPVVTHMVWYGVGGADEPLGISGTAHFLEHLLFKGTANQAPGEFSRIVKSMGGRDNAFTSWDYTAYFQTIPSEYLEKAMRLEADRMRGANPSQDHFLTERDVVIEERRQTLDTSPGARLSEQMRNALFVNHPYGRPIIGWMHEIKALDWSEIKKFYDRWYSPSNAVLIVAGDVDPADFFQQAQDIYGLITPFEVPSRIRPKAAVFDTEKVITMRDDLVKQRSFSRITKLHNIRQNPMDALSISLIGMMMDGGATSRLYKSIVVDQKKAIGVSLSYNGFYRDYGTLSISGTPVDGVSLDDLEAAMNAEFMKAAKEGFTQEELDRAKSRMVDSQIFELDSVTGPAMVFGYSVMAGLDLEYLEYWTHFLEYITLEDVNAKAADILSTATNSQAKDKNNIWSQSVYGYLLPRNFDKKD